MQGLLALVCWALLLLQLGAVKVDQRGWDNEEKWESKYVTIVAPTETLDESKGVYKLKTIGPDAYICAKYDRNEPWMAYEKLDSYTNKNNAKNVRMKTTTYPMTRSIPQTEEAIKKGGTICHYLERTYHCDVPDATTYADEMIEVPKTPKRKYYSHDFWGQAPDGRVNYYIKKMIEVFDTDGITDTIDMNYAYLSTFPDNLKEVVFYLKKQ